MRLFFKQKGIFAPACLIVASFFILVRPVTAQTVLTQWNQGTLQMKISPLVRVNLESSLNDLGIAAQKLQSILGQRPVTKPLVIWLLKDADERDAALRSLGFDPAKNAGSAARTQDQIFLILPTTLDPGWLSRFVLSEYARYLLMSNGPEDGMEWFRNGMAITLGWYVREEVERGDWKSCLQKLQSYYGTKIKPDPDLTVKQLSVPGAWRKALEKKDKSNLMARTVILYISSMQKRGPAGGSTVLNIWEREKDMRAALERGADTSIEKLDAILTQAEGSVKP